MSGKIEITFSCRNCAHQIDILNDEELLNLIGDDCTFCRNGVYSEILIKLDDSVSYQTIQLFLGEKEIFKQST